MSVLPFLSAVTASCARAIGFPSQAYYQSLRRVQLSGPTLFQAVINQAAQIANSTKHRNSVRSKTVRTRRLTQATSFLGEGENPPLLICISYARSSSNTGLDSVLCFVSIF